MVRRIEKERLPIESSKKGDDQAEMRKTDEQFLEEFASTFLAK